MKTNKLSLTLFLSFLLVTGCREKEDWIEDSQYITVASPLKDQVIQDSDSIRLEAQIEPKFKTVENYYVSMLTDDKQTICSYRKICEDKDKSKVIIDTAFSHNVSKTSKVLLFVEAKLEDGTYIRDETPFKLVDAKK